MTKQYGFVVDVSRCTGCRTCAVACKDAHNLPVGLNLRRVLEEASGSWRQDRMTGAWHQDVRAWYVSIACNHCENPACVKVCPTKAHYGAANRFGAFMTRFLPRCLVRRIAGGMLAKLK